MTGGLISLAPLLMACASPQAATIIFGPASTASQQVVNRIEGLGAAVLRAARRRSSARAR